MRNILLLIFTLFVCCSKEKVFQPEKTVLLYPLNYDTCIQINDTINSTSNINFVWKNSNYTDSYELVIKNITTEEIKTYKTNFTNFQASIKNGFSYNWWVNSMSNSLGSKIKSDTWLFFLEKQVDLNYLPYSARLVQPQNNSKVNLLDNQIEFKWEGYDVDNDIVNYSLNYGFTIDNLDKTIENISATSVRIQLNKNQTYFWQVVTVDSKGNKSFSTIYEFTTN